MTQQFTVAGSLTVIVVLVVLWFVRQASVAKRHLDARERLLVAFLGNPDQRELQVSLQTDPELLLARRGMTLTPATEGLFLLKQMRAHSRSCQIRIISAVEVMPQIGLLGTVVGLIMGLLIQGPESISGLAVALLTTLVGLFAAIICKVTLEVPAQERMNTILELLEDERIVTAITSLGAGATRKRSDPPVEE